jgi:hypothetical protein
MSICLYVYMSTSPKTETTTGQRIHTPMNTSNDLTYRRTHSTFKCLQSPLSLTRPSPIFRRHHLSLVLLLVPLVPRSWQRSSLILSLIRIMSTSDLDPTWVFDNDASEVLNSQCIDDYISSSLDPVQLLDVYSQSPMMHVEETRHNSTVRAYSSLWIYTGVLTCNDSASRVPTCTQLLTE